MLFAFTWVIISDLVGMHINVICNIDIYDNHPFAKTQKSDKKSSKVKKDKNGDDDEALYNLLYIGENTTSLINNYCLKIIPSTKTLFFTDADFEKYLQNRAPPIV